MIKVFTLVENTSKSDEFKAKHGLSLYIETNNHKILFDVGPDNTFLINAAKKGIDIKKIDTVVISHGHNDHGGGLPYFLKVNNLAKIYIKKEAFIKHLSKRKFIFHNIGISNLDIDKERLIFVDDILSIDDELTLFSNVTERKLYSSMNNNLYSQDEDKTIHKDNFSHEQYLVVSDNNNDVLFTGCSHNGVVNIVEKYEQNNSEKHRHLKCVIGGFHLYSPGSKKYESYDRIIELSKWIATREENYITCHCTGIKAFKLLKRNTNDKVIYLRCGEFITII